MTLLLTFANDKDAHLDLLKAESADIRNALRPLENRDFIKIKHEESTTTDELVSLLLSLPNEIVVFHYAGHAGSAELRFEDVDGNAKGLAHLLGEQANLKLVFLNGCSTKGQVEQLFEAGVKGVIATSVPINDAKAKDFAVAFYEALANRRTIKRAFELAKNVLELKYKTTPEVEISRAIGKMPQHTEGSKSAAEPWILYLKEGFSDEVGDFRLPTYQQVSIPIQEIAASMTANKFLVFALPEMCNYNKDIYSQMVEMRRGEEVKRDSSTYLDLVIQNFPFVIGAQIQLLRQKTTPDFDRLEQLISTYVVVGQTLYYILLADFWNHKDKLKFPTDKNFLKNHQLTAETTAVSFDYFQHIIDLYAAFPDTEKDNLFVPEFKKLVENLGKADNPTAKARQQLDILRGSFRTTAPDQLTTICVRAEQMLALILKEAAFLAGYQMLTVRNIELDAPRSKKLSYELQMARLNAIVHTSLSFYNDDIYRRKAHFTNSDSIVLISGNELLNEANALHFYLNLSPFIIDKNTFLNQPHIDLYLYAFERDDIYHYYSIKHPIFIATANEKGTDIVHTGMTRGDFKEGKNITDQAKTNTDEFDAAFSEAFGAAAATVVSDPTLVFGDLENQFEQFKTEFA
jgi:CHAT domain